MIDMLLAAGKHLVATLKENQPGLLAEARMLLPAETPEHLDLPAIVGKSARHAELRHAHTTVYFAELIAADLLGDRWWPPRLP